MKPKLITMPGSHYCERARWALDYFDIEFQEEPHVMRIHRHYTSKHKAGTSVPVLVMDDRVLETSGEILAWASAGAGAYDESDYEVAQMINDSLGEFMRPFCYWYILQLSSWKIGGFYNEGAPLWERAFFQVVFPIFRGKIIEGFGLNEALVKKLKKEIDEVMDSVADRIAVDGYLNGNHFTIADLTFAALAGPLVMPENYGARFPKREWIPQEYLDLVEEWRQHPAGKHILKMYKQYR